MKAPGALLCVSNFGSGTGYAWTFIESLYAGVSDRLADRGVQTFVAYPNLDRTPATLEGSAAQAIETPSGLRGLVGAAEALRLVRRLGVRVVYLSDRPAWHPSYPLLKLAGVRSIVVHDHTSGDRVRPRGVRRLVKRARNLVPGALADHVLAVSDFVARRKIEVDLVPPSRIATVWNSLEIPADLASVEARADAIRRELAIGPERPLVVCACRASPPKGLAVLFRAFDRVARERAMPTRPVLLYAGDGPLLDDLRALRDGLAARDDIHLLGYRRDAADVLGAADVAVVPSLWAEAFGLAALEPMSRGRAVIASRAGGLPEVVVDRETGLLVEPGDDVALANALNELLADPQLRARLGRNGRRRAQMLFARDRQLDRLAEIVARCFAEA